MDTLGVRRLLHENRVQLLQRQRLFARDFRGYQVIKLSLSPLGSVTLPDGLEVRLLGLVSLNFR